MRAPEDSFERELVGHYAYLLRVARGRLRNSDEAGDLVQETMVRGLVYRTSFRPGTNMRAWLCFIMRNLHLSDLRRSWRRVSMPDGLAEAQPALGNQHSSIALRELLDAVALLPLDQREALLAVADGNSYEIAAEDLAASVGTIKSRVLRARHALDLYFGELS